MRASSVLLGIVLLSAVLAASVNDNSVLRRLNDHPGWDGPDGGGGSGDWRGGGGVVGVLVPDCAEGLFMSGLSSRVHAAVLQEVEAGLQVEAEFQGVQGVERV